MLGRSRAQGNKQSQEEETSHPSAQCQVSIQLKEKDHLDMFGHVKHTMAPQHTGDQGEGSPQCYRSSTPRLPQLGGQRRRLEIHHNTTAKEEQKSCMSRHQQRSFA